MRTRFALAAVLLLSSSAVQVYAQTAPQPARDHVYGPGGRIAVTVEPDIYPPSEPYPCSASQAGPCAIDGIDVTWGAATDIGSGVAYYLGPGGQTTGFSYHDSGVQGGECYVYYVSAVDNAGHEGPTAQSNTVCVQLCLLIPEANASFTFPRPKTRSVARFTDLNLLRSRDPKTQISRLVIRRRQVPRPTTFDAFARAVFLGQWDPQSGEYPFWAHPSVANILKLGPRVTARRRASNLRYYGPPLQFRISTTGGGR